PTQPATPPNEEEAPGAGGPAVVSDVPRGKRAEGRLHRAKPHGARGQVHDLRVLAAAGIGLEPPESPELAELLAGQAAQEVLDRVEGGSGMGLDGDHGALTQVGEIEGGQEPYRRGGGGLVPADLGPVRVRTEVIGVVHHPGREPEDPGLYAFERREGRPLLPRASPPLRGQPRLALPTSP